MLQESLPLQQLHCLTYWQQHQRSLGEPEQFLFQKLLSLAEF
jgi:hypothetical protein